MTHTPAASPIEPSIGRIVWVRSTNPELMGNGAVEVPGIVTRVWNNDLVNVTVFRDGDTPLPLGSVTHIDEGDPAYPADFSIAWRWMPFQKGQARGASEPTGGEQAAPKRDGADPDGTLAAIEGAA